MRSFSILVIAWFFACLVSVRGEELDWTLKEVFMPRLRFNHKRKVVTMSAPTELPDGVSSILGTTNTSLSVPKANKKGFARRRENPSRINLKNIRTKVLNAFYPPLGIYSAARKYKYCTSHYEVNLGIVDQIGSSTRTPLEEAYFCETSPSALCSTIKLGGTEFHNAVRQAAFKANKEFLNDTSVISIDQLCSVFYAILYNSRQLYSLLCTALRCQNMVNAVDEDGVYLNPIFSKHVLRLPTLDPQNTTLISEGWQNYVGLDVMSGLVTRHSSNYVTFSDPVSNAWWNQLWGNALNYIRLPKKWMEWCEKMFSNVHLIEPTDGSIYPRFVVFWPDSKFIRYQTGGTNKFDYLANYVVHNTGTISLSNSSLVTDLAPYVDEMATFFNNMMQALPQLEIMFQDLGCSYTSIPLDITRDITARTVRLNRSYTVEKLIYSAALPFYAAMNSTHTSYTTYRTSYARDRKVVPACWVTLDPQFKNNVLTKGERVEISRATFSYTTYAEFTEMDYILANSNIAPISFETFSDMQINNVRQLRYISAPSLSFAEYGNALDDIVITGTFSSTFMLQRIVTAFDDLFHVKSTLKVLPRMSASIDDLGNPLTSDELTAVINGYYPIALTTNNTIDDEINLSLRDYLVPTLVQVEAIDNYADFLATT